MMTQHIEDIGEETAASTEQTAHRRHGREGEGSEWWGSQGATTALPRAVPLPDLKPTNDNF